ncbi:MAG: hypothetical protein F6J97_13605 [Leptolyngbya sp. SIO4C1]|nr:hypothetical protein [Leptolyngbya sp. SIO4C1]
MAQPTAQDQYMLELLNQTRANPQAEANRLLGGKLNQDLAAGTISGTPKQPLAFNPKLFTAARDHGQWMLNTNQFSHTGAEGSRPWDRAGAAGYSWSRVGENIAWRGTTGSLNFDSAVKQNEDGLFKSAGHRTNILSDSYREVGISNLSGRFNGYNAAMTTQLFGSDRSGNAFLTGVVYSDAVADDDFYTIGEGLGKVTVKATGNGQTFSTKTMNAGGYQLRLAPGSYAVSFEGDFDGDGQLDQTQAKTVTLGNRNVKLDLATDSFQAASAPQSVLPANPPNPPTADRPVAYLKLDDATGRTATDSSGSSHAGTLTGNARWTKGKRGGGVALDGSGDAVAIASAKDIDMDLYQQRTVSLWFKADSLTGSQPQVLFEAGGGSRGLNAYLQGNQLYVGGWNRPRRQSGWSGTWLSTQGIQAGQWHHVALVLDGSSRISQGALTGYLDGEQFARGAGSQLWRHADGVGVGSINGKTRFHSGTATGDSYGLTGTVDEVKIFNSALEADQIQALTA